MGTSAQHPRMFQMPSHGWGMLKRIIRAYGAAQDEETSNVESVAKLAGVPRPSVSSNNNFLRSIGVLDLDKPKLTALGVKLATGIGLENESIITEALQEVVRTTPVFNQLWNTLRARGSMDSATFRGQVILGTGLKPSSPNLATIKALTDLFEESGLVEIRDDKVSLVGQASLKDNGGMNSEPVTVEEKALPALPKLGTGVVASVPIVEMLLSKFPEFNPEWSEEVQMKWFDAFDRLMKGRGL